MKNISRQLFRVKDLNSILSEAHDPSRKLKKALGPFDLILFGIGAIVGAGIFTSLGTAVAGDSIRPGAGPAIMLSFVITAIACGFSALCYAELAALVPISGSAYTYSYAAFGELIAWIIGWDLIIEYSIANVAVALSWSSYFVELLRGLGIHLPVWSTIDFRSAMQGFHKASELISSGQTFEQLEPYLQHTWTAVQGAPHIFGIPIICNLPASFIIIALTVILVIGIKESARFNAIMVIFKLLVLGLFVVIGIYYIKPHNWVPFAPNGFAGIRAGAAVVFFAYLGFDAVSTVAEETRNPKRDLPIGIIGSLIACTIIYVIVAIVFTGMVPYSLLNTTFADQKAEPLTVAMKYVNINWAAGIIAFGAVVANTAVLLVSQLGQARIFFAMSRDGLIPAVFSRVHPRFKTPHINTIIIGAFVAFFAAFTNIDEMVDLTNIGTLFAFILVCIGVIILRIKDPHRPRGFKVPFNPLLPLLGVVACIFLMTGLSPITWVRFFLWLIVGLIIYFAYSYRHSLLHHKTHDHQDKNKPDAHSV